MQIVMEWFCNSHFCGKFRVTILWIYIGEDKWDWKWVWEWGWGINSVIFNYFSINFQYIYLYYIYLYIFFSICTRTIPKWTNNRFNFHHIFVDLFKFDLNHKWPTVSIFWKYVGKTKTSHMLTLFFTDFGRAFFITKFE